MPRESRPLDRDGGQRLRDASLLVIASEDRYAAKQYFDRFSGRRIQVVVLPTEIGDSSPAGVLERLNRFRGRYQLLPDDRLWLCLDSDHWIEPDHISGLHRVLGACHKASIRVALSCPCFDFWLLLHVTDEPAVAEAVGSPTCRQVGERIREVLGTYNKRRVDLLPLTESQVRAAMERARSRWGTVEGEIPTSPSTGVHRILDDIAARGPFVFR